MKTRIEATRRTHSALPACLIALLASGISRAESIPGQLFDHIPQRAWLENYDPTLVSSRTFAEFSYERYDTGADLFKIENTLRWGIPLKDDHALGLQMMLPVKWSEMPEEDAFGLGDLECRAGFVGRILPCLRYGLGVNAVIDSATDDLLGDDAFILRPILALRWDVTDRITPGINIEYNVTPLDEDIHDVSALELKFPLAFKLTEEWSAFISYNPRWNYLDESDRQRLEIGGSRVWGPENQFALTFGTEIPLASESFEFKLATGFAWYF